MSLFRTKTATASKSDSKTLVFSGKRLQGTWSVETKLPMPVRRSTLDSSLMVFDNRRVRSLH